MTTALTIIETDNLPSINGQLDQNPAAVYLASLTSPQSKRTMHQALDAIAGIVSNGQLHAFAIQWAGLRFQHTSAIRAALSQKYKPATANKMLCALRGVLKAAYQLGQISHEDYRKALDFKAVKGETLPAGRDIAQGEIISLVQACKTDKTATGARDAAMIGLLYACGLRRAELVALNLSDVDATTGKITVQSGKGRKSRIVYATNGALTALQAWLNWRGLNAGSLFVRIRKGGNLTDARLTTQAVYTILKGRASEAGVKDFSPHDFRRTFVGDLLDRGADIATVQKLAGHADVKTTARYDRRSEETKKKAAGLLHFPF